MRARLLIERWMHSVAPVAANAARLLACRHGRGAHGGAGHDDRLGDVGQGQLAAQGRRGGGEGRHAGRDRPGDAERVEAADLLGDGAVERGVAGMDPGDVLALGVRGLDLGHDLVEVHGGRVDHAAPAGASATTSAGTSEPA